jgi:hypothetical protein
MLRVYQCHSQLPDVNDELEHMIVVDLDNIIKCLHYGLQDILVIDLARFKQLLHNELLLLRDLEVLISNRCCSCECLHCDICEFNLLGEHVHQDCGEYLIHVFWSEIRRVDIFADETKCLK